jgi:hypothetical protein
MSQTPKYCDPRDRHRYRQELSSHRGPRCARRRAWPHLSGVAFAQQKLAKEQFVGAWTLVSVTMRWTMAIKENLSVLPQRV